MILVVKVEAINSINNDFGSETCSLSSLNISKIDNKEYDIFARFKTSDVIFFMQLFAICGDVQCVKEVTTNNKPGGLYDCWIARSEDQFTLYRPSLYMSTLSFSLKSTIILFAVLNLTCSLVVTITTCHENFYSMNCRISEDTSIALTLLFSILLVYTRVKLTEECN
jgi:hypothetical protein